MNFPLYFFFHINVDNDVLISEIIVVTSISSSYELYRTKSTQRDYKSCVCLPKNISAYKSKTMLKFRKRSKLPRKLLPLQSSKLLKLNFCNTKLLLSVL